MVRKSLLQLRSFITLALSLVFPKICFACAKRIDDEDPFLCYLCKRELVFPDDLTCPKCGAFDVQVREICSYCSKEMVYFDKCASLFPYNNTVRTLIHELKYNEMTKIANYFAAMLIEYLERDNPFTSGKEETRQGNRPMIDHVCPVPLHPTKERVRGYNQAAKIAEMIAETFKWNYSPNLIKRTKYTISQSALSPEDRKLNVGKAFSVDRKGMLEDSNILVIDDVFTTGATVNSLSKLLKEHRVNRVFILTVARA